MGYLIRDVDLGDEAELRAFHDVMVRAETRDGRPWTRPQPFVEMVQELRSPRMTESYEGYLALDGDRVVGVVVQGYFLKDNLDKAWLNLYVDPEARRRGVGSALLEYAVGRAREAGRSSVLADTTYAFELRDDAPAVHFAKRHGFVLGNTEVIRTLRLPVAETLLDELAAEAAERSAGYELFSYTGQMPEELQQGWCDVVNRLSVDAPGGEIDWEVTGVTPESYREGTRRLADVGRTRIGTLALRDGEVVAETHLTVTEGDPRAEQWSTIVAAPHRGHRLGAAVKVANLRQLAALRPDCTEVETQNAETNAFMVDINVRLGFEPTALCPEFLRRL